MAGLTPAQDSLYERASAEYTAPLERLARAYEADPETRRDLMQEIHVALWRSFANFNGFCSMRTWVFRVAHNTAISHILRQRRGRGQLMVSLEELEALPAPAVPPEDDHQQRLDQLLALIRQLKPLDRQVILAYLEEMDAVAIGEITGLSPGNVATKIHRIKQLLSRRFRSGEKT
jgi:RNA polymerase sigma-70 factor, ECF subfamily